MPATEQNIEHWAGDTHVITIRVTDGNPDNPQPVDLTGALSVRWWMGKNVKATGADIYVQKSLAAGTLSLLSASTDDPFWYVRVRLLPADTDGRKAGTFYHECEIVDAAGDVSTVTTGAFIMNGTMIPDIL